MGINSFDGKFELTDDGSWLEQLENSIDKKASSFKGTKDFLCCLISHNRQSKKYDDTVHPSKHANFLQDKKFRCHAISARLKLARLKSITQTLKCETGNTAYQLTIAN